jgi:hypothetical protein
MTQPIKVVRKPHARRGYVRRDGTRVRPTKVRGTAYYVQSHLQQPDTSVVTESKPPKNTLNKLRQELNDLSRKEVIEIAGDLLSAKEKKLKKERIITILVYKLKKTQ